MSHKKTKSREGSGSKSRCSNDSKGSKKSNNSGRGAKGMKNYKSRTNKMLESKEKSLINTYTEASKAGEQP